MNNKIKTKAKAIFSKDGKFQDFQFERRALKEKDVLIKIKFAGICHSDIHHAKDEWKWTNANYPMVPGHEIAGEIVAIGDKVTKFKIGDNAGVGCLVNSCRECEYCKQDYENQCSKSIPTYNGFDYYNNNELTYGGYSDYIVVDQDFAIKAPKNAPLEYVAPLMCAGITTYSPIVFSKVKKGNKVAVAGFGGLGSMAVKYAKKFGADVYVIARNRRKEEEAKKLGVTKLFDSLSQVDIKFDLIISTIPTSYNIDDYIKLLKIGGEMAILGLPSSDQEWNLWPGSLIFNNHRKIYGSVIGGIKQTQEMLNFSLENQIYPEVEIIKPNQIDEAYEKMVTGKAKFRYVIDMKDF